MISENYKNELGGWAIGSVLFDWIHENLPKGSTILEFGSGAGSALLAQDYNVCSVEHDLAWVAKYPTVKYVYAPIVDGWYAETLFSHIPKSYDLILVDGPPGNIGRSEIIHHFDKLNPDVTVIFDDTDRVAESNLASEFSRRYRSGMPGTTVQDGGKSFTVFRGTQDLTVHTKPGLCLNMIVKDEESNLPRLFESIHPWIDYFVISDTGSTDRTIELIHELSKKYEVPGEVIENEWQNFGHNRTLALNGAYEAREIGRHKCDWAITIDADEMLKVEDPNWIEKLDRDRSYSIDKVESSIRYHVNHIINLSHERWDWRGPAHNYSHRISGSNPIGWTGGAHIVRDSASLGGKSRKFNGNMRQKYMHDADLFEKELAKNPNDARSQFYLGQSYRDANELELAYDSYVKRAKMTNGWYQECYISWLEAGKLAKRMDRNNDAIHCFMQAYNLMPRRPEAGYELSTLVKSMDMIDMAYVISKDAASRMRTESKDLFLNHQVSTWMLKDRHSINAYWKGEWLESYELSKDLLKIINQIPEEHHDRIRNNMRLSKEKVIELGLLHPPGLNL